MFPSAGDLSIKANITYRLSPSSKILTWSCKPIRNTSRRKPYTAQEQEAAYRLDNGDYLYIQTCESGYDYTFYREDFSEIDGGQLDNPDLSMLSARDEILALHERKDTAIEKLDVEAFEQAQEAAQTAEPQEPEKPEAQEKPQEPESPISEKADTPEQAESA